MEMFNVSTDASLASLVGSRYDTADGRELVLVQVNGTAVVPGKLYTVPVAVGANHQNLVTVAYAAPTNNLAALLTVTLGGTLVTANQYAGGYAHVHTGTGIGQIMKIASHPAQATTTGNVVLTLEDTPVTALDTTSTIDLILNPAGSSNGTNVATNGIVIHDHSNLRVPVGVSFYAIAASTATVPSYGFLQTKGVGSVLSHSTPAIGLDVGASASVDGAVDAYAVATGARIGTAMITGVDTDSMTIQIQL